MATLISLSLCPLTRHCVSWRASQSDKVHKIRNLKELKVWLVVSQVSAHSPLTLVLQGLRQGRKNSTGKQLGSWPGGRERQRQESKEQKRTPKDPFSSSNYQPLSVHHLKISCHSRNGAHHSMSGAPQKPLRPPNP